MKSNLVNELMNEVILYGGLPVRRGDVYLDALERTRSRWAADMYAFKSDRVIVDAVPLTREQLRKVP